MENGKAAPGGVAARGGSANQARLVEKTIHELLPCPLARPEAFAEGVRKLAAGRLREALGDLQTAARENPDAYCVHHLLGHAWGGLESHQEEVESYKKAVKLKPGYPQVYFDLGLAYWLLGKEKKAFAAFKQGILMAPEFPLADFWLTFTFESLGRYPAALAPESRELREKSRRLAQAYYMLGNAYTESGQHAPARQAYKEAVRVKPDFASAYYQLGALHIKKLRNAQRAEKYLRRAEDLFLQQSDLKSAALAHQLMRPAVEAQEQAQIAEEWLKEGLRLQKLGRYQGAVDSYKEAIHHRPRFLDAYYNMGVAYGCLHDSGVPRIDKAVGALREAVRIKPDFEHAHIALGISYLKQNEYAEAIAALQAAEKIVPDNATVAYYLGVAHRLSSDFRAAAGFLKRAAALQPDAEEMRYTLGLVFMDMGQFEEAIQAFEEAARLKPDFADGHYMLGMLRASRQIDRERAAAHFKKAERLYLKLENHVYAARARQALDNLEE